MTKVLIVDDEVLVRVGIKSILNWEKHNYHVVADASNGLEALEKIEKYQPDIVLTDLMMEPMDGFELIAECERRGLHIKFIVLSNYNDFENVRKAMKLGAFDYIFKLTVKSDELLKILNDANQDNLKLEVDNGTANVIKKNIDAIKSSLLDKILDSNSYRLESINNELNSIPLNINLNKKYVVMCIAIDNFEIVRKKGNFPDLNLLKFTMGNIITELMNQVGNCEVFFYKDKNFFVIFNQEKEFEEFRNSINKEFSLLIKYIKQYIGLEISAALSEQYVGIEHLKDAMVENMKALEKRFYYETGGLYFNKYYKDKEVNFSIDSYLIELKEDILKKDHTQIYQCTQHLLEVLDNRQEYKVIEIRQMLTKMYKTIGYVFSQSAVDVDVILNKDGVSLADAISGYSFYKTIRKNVTMYLKLYIQESEVNKGKPCRKEISQVKGFVQSHLNEELSVSRMSMMVNMSESRFSHVFKEEVGISFLEYVNQVKEDEAMYLLKSTDMKINEIADMIGIDNPNYFSALFKKRTGLSPNGYRRREWDSRN